MSCAKPGSSKRGASITNRSELIDYGLQHRPGNPLENPDEVMTADKIGNGEIFPADFLDDAKSYLPDVGDYGGSEVVKILKSIQGKPEAEVTIYRGAPSNGVLNQGDWVTLSKDYAMAYAYDGSYSDNSNSKVYAYKAKARDLSFDGDSIHEFGYWGKKQNKGTLIKK